MKKTKEIKLVKIEPDKKYLDVTWQVNNLCNFKCSYCNPGNYEGTRKNNGNTETYINSLKAITDKYKDHGYENFKFFFSGGEPTMWKNLIPIVTWIKENLPNAITAVNTNFSRPLAWWKKHYHLFDDIVASYHIEFTDPEKYLENAKLLHNKVNYLSCKMLLHEERFWDVVEFGERLKRELPNYFIEWTPLYNEMTVNAGPWQYSDPKKIDFIKSHSSDSRYLVEKPTLKTPFYTYSHWSDGSVNPTLSNEVIIKRLNYFKGWNCSIGDSVWIDQRGYVSMGTCGQVEFLGDILTDFDKIGPKTIKCQKEFCHCGTDIMIPKIAPEGK